MSSIDENNFNHFMPQNLFVNQLNSGHFELSVYFMYDMEDENCVDQMEWEIKTEESNFFLRSTYPIPNQGEGSRRAIPITATLPQSWESGVLKVQLEIDNTPSFFETPINQFNQEKEFIFPLSGQALTVVGHRIGETHRSAFQIPSQQFGWDFLGLGRDDLSIVHIDESMPLQTSDFPGFGMEVIAPLNGRVYDVKDGESDIQEIGQLPQELSYYQEDLTRALGNYVVLEHEGKMWSVLAHLKKNSIQVSAGQMVSTEDVLGALGNSGFTSGPHLHFHVMDSPDILDASPLPVMLALEDGVFAPQAGDIISNG